VRPERVIFHAPFFNQRLRFFQGIKDLGWEIEILFLTYSKLKSTVLLFLILCFYVKKQVLFLKET
jgi:hypothetical protein